MRTCNPENLPPRALARRRRASVLSASSCRREDWTRLGWFELVRRVELKRLTKRLLERHRARGRKVTQDAWRKSWIRQIQSEATAPLRNGVAQNGQRWRWHAKMFLLGPPPGRMAASTQTIAAPSHDTNNIYHTGAIDSR